MASTKPAAKTPRTQTPDPRASAAPKARARAQIEDETEKKGAIPEEALAATARLLAAGGNLEAAKLKEPTKREAELVTAAVPRPLMLTDDNSVVHKYDVGVQDMPRAHAEHWYAKAHGVEIQE